MVSLCALSGAYVPDCPDMFLFANCLLSLSPVAQVPDLMLGLEFPLAHQAAS